MDLPLVLAVSLVSSLSRLAPCSNTRPSPPLQPPHPLHPPAAAAAAAGGGDNLCGAPGAVVPAPPGQGEQRGAAAAAGGPQLAQAGACCGSSAASGGCVGTKQQHEGAAEDKQQEQQGRQQQQEQDEQQQQRFKSKQSSDRCWLADICAHLPRVRIHKNATPANATPPQLQCPSVWSDATKRLSVVIPAYNEEDRLPATLDETLRCARRRGVHAALRRQQRQQQQRVTRDACTRVRTLQHRATSSTPLLKRRSAEVACCRGWMDVQPDICRIRAPCMHATRWALGV